MMNINPLSEFYKNKKVLVTGGAGFIGSHLCEQLTAAGACVRILDNFSTGSLDNLTYILDQIEVIKGSITNFDTCLEASKGTDIIFHLAALVSVAECEKDPSLGLITNITGTHHILEAARLMHTKRVILASSAAVYGSHEGLCSEDIPPRPVSTYGHSKFIAEQLCQLYAQNYNLETICLRFFNVYGPRQNPNAGNGGVLAVFHHKLAHNQPLLIFGDGTQTRDFIHVDQVVRATIQAGMFNNVHATGNPFNIATGKSVSLHSKLQELLAQYVDYKQQITYTSDRPGDIKHSLADCSKFKNALL